MEENVLDVLARIAEGIRSLENQTADATASDLYAFVVVGLIRRHNHWPSHGQIVTEIARIEAGLRRFDETARDRVNTIAVYHESATRREFWAARRDRVPAELQGELDKLLAACAPEAVEKRVGKFSSTPLDHRLEEAVLMRDDKASRELYRERQDAWTTTWRTSFEDAIASALADLLTRTADLPEMVREDMQKLFVNHNALLAVSTSDWTKACKRLVEDRQLGLGNHVFKLVLCGDPVSSDAYDIRCFERLVEICVKDPTSTLELQTPTEIEVNRSMRSFVLWQVGQPTDGTSEFDERRSIVLLPNGTINDLRHAASAGELLLAFRTLGVDPSQPAARVISRQGCQGYPATWYVHPVSEELTVLVVLHRQNSLFNQVYTVKGDLGEALAWLSGNYHALEWKENRLDLDDAPDDVPRSIVEALQATDAVAQARAHEAQAAALLAAPASPTV